jgi:hypothetical protein
MAYLGNAPTSVPLSSADILDGAITSAKIANGTITTADLASGVGGKVLQVVQSVKTDTFSSSSSSFVDITGLSISITPSSASNKILVMANIVGAGIPATNIGHFRIVRGATAIYVGDSAGTRTQSFIGTMASDVNGSISSTAIFLDSPSSTSALTYKIQGLTTYSSFYVNRSSNDSDDGTRPRTASSITVMEISA